MPVAHVVFMCRVHVEFMFIEGTSLDSLVAVAVSVCRVSFASVTIGACPGGTCL